MNAKRLEGFERRIPTDHNDNVYLQSADYYRRCSSKCLCNFRGSN